MSDFNDILMDLLKAIGFVLAIVLGGLIIAGFVDGWNESRERAEVDAAQYEPPLPAD